jgi:ParB family chromosome partitioning protein
LSRKALGKGIRAIIPEETQEALAAEARPIRLDEIRPNPFQPRANAQENLDELVQSIKEKGVLQPVLVRRRRDGYELVMGERRFRAAGLAGLAEIPAVVRSVEDAEMLELALVENVQRRDLNPMEEALAFQRLTGEFSLTHEDVAKRVGKDRSTVTNALRLLALPFKVRDALAAGQITAGHARALLQVENRRVQVELCERIVRDGLSVRVVERLCAGARPRKPRVEPERDVHVRELEEKLQEALGTRVSIREPRKAGAAGEVAIQYFSTDDLNRIAGRIRGGKA